MSKSKSNEIVIEKNGDRKTYEFRETDFEFVKQMGSGSYGHVDKLVHLPSQTLVARKRIIPQGETPGELASSLREFEHACQLLLTNTCPFVVVYYGVRMELEPPACAIFMEFMDASLDRVYKFVYERKRQELSEELLGSVAVAAVSALNYLKEAHRIIHRDVKPSNILASRRGQIKLCDFGISGRLINSYCKTNIGCQLYMAPERIVTPEASPDGFDVRSDVWSLGITLYELATGTNPYTAENSFDLYMKMRDNPEPRIESPRLSAHFKSFVNQCLTSLEKRPKYSKLLLHPLIEKHSKNDVSLYVEALIDQMNE